MQSWEEIDSLDGISWADDPVDNLYELSQDVISSSSSGKKSVKKIGV
jgi:hypothetical protein